MKKATIFKSIKYKVANQHHWTFDIVPIKEFVDDELLDANFRNEYKYGYKGIVLNIFTGKNYLNDNEFFLPNIHIVNNDISTEFRTDENYEALEFLKAFPNESIELVIFDPPFNLRKHKEFYQGSEKYTNYNKWIWDLKMEIARVLKVGGVCLSCGYETNGIGVIKGFEKENLLIVAHGGSLRDTLCYTESKIESNKHYNTWRDK